MKYILLFLFLLSGIIVYPQYSIPKFNEDSKFLLDTMTYTNVRELTEINSPNSANLYPWISYDGLRLYFTQKTGGYYKIYFAERDNFNSNFKNKSELSINQPNKDMLSIWLNKEETQAYFIIYDRVSFPKLFFAYRDTLTSNFSAPIPVNLKGRTNIRAILAPSLDNSNLYIYNNINNVSEQIYRFSKIDSLNFTYKDSILTPLGYVMKPGQLSKDNLAFLISLQETAFKKSSLFYFSRTHPLLQFKYLYFPITLTEANVSYYDNYQPSASEYNSVLVFVYSDTPSSESSKLYIAYNQVTDIPKISHKSNISAYPNPATSGFSISYNLTSEFKKSTLQIFDIKGIKIKEITLSNSSGIVNFSERELPKGCYFFNIYSSNLKTISKKLIIL